MFQRLSEHGIIINPDKCKLGVSQHNILSLALTQSYDARNSAIGGQSSVIRDFSQPTSQHKLQEFLGLVNFYHRFISNCAATLKRYSMTSHLEPKPKLKNYIGMLMPLNPFK